MHGWLVRGATSAALITALAGVHPANALDPAAGRKLDGPLRVLLLSSADPASLVDSPIFCVAQTERSAEPLIEVVFQASTLPASIDEVAGLELGANVGRVHTARLPLSQVETLAALPEVISVEASVRLHKLLDESIPASRIDEVWIQGYTGDNVIVGVIDTGIDFEHDDFRFEKTGETRLLAVCDHSTGTEQCWEEGQINAFLGGLPGITQVDTDGHGTHVTSTAAGNGLALFPEEFVGAARDANIIGYKAHDGIGLPTSWVIAGIAAIESRANSLGRSAVINLSLGGHFGAHDGSSALEAAIDDFSGFGRVVVTAAGNDGEEPIHFTGTGSFTRDLLVTHGAAPAQGVDDFLYYDVWYPGADAVTIQIQGPNGFDQTFDPATFGQGGDLLTGSVFVDNASQGVSPNGDKNATIILGVGGGVGTFGPADGTWTFSFSGSVGAVHGWLASSSLAMGEILDADYSHLVAVPGTANTAITVGAWVSKECWEAAAAVERCTYNSWGGSWRSVQFGYGAPFTSPGPTRDGRLKPEVAGPGMEVTAALSSDAFAPPFTQHPSGRYMTIQGTSMASPHVAGVVALFLERSPTATHTTMRNAFTSTSSLPGGGGGAARQGATVTTVFDENFESASGWTFIDGGGLTGDGWAINSSWSLSPGTGAVVNASAANQVETIVSPAIALPSGEQITLDFWHGFQTPSQANDDHTVGVRLAGTSDPFAEVHTYTPSAISRFWNGFDQGISPWTQELSADLTPWGGQSVEIGWTYRGSTSNGNTWFLDDVRVTSTTGGGWNPWLGHGLMDARDALDEAVPVDVLSFRGTYRPETIHVSWRITDARHTRGFLLSRAQSREGAYAPVHEGTLDPDVESFVDRGVSPGRIYFYRLTELLVSGNETYGPIEVRTGAPGGRPITALLAAAPNPFNPRTSINFVVAEEAPVGLDIYDTAGRHVRTLIAGSMVAGRHEAVWDGTDDAGRSLGSGTYFYRLVTGETDQTRRMVLLR